MVTSTEPSLLGPAHGLERVRDGLAQDRQTVGLPPPHLGHRPSWVPKACFTPHQLLSAASLFQLDALQRHCEILCSQNLSVESAVNTYKYAKVRARAPAPISAT